MGKILLTAVAAAVALTTFAAPDATDSAAPAPRAQYRSVFQDTPHGVEEASDDWRKANAAVGQFTRGHADLLKWENERAATMTRGAASQPSVPAPKK